MQEEQGGTRTRAKDAREIGQVSLGLLLARATWTQGSGRESWAKVASTFSFGGLLASVADTKSRGRPTQACCVLLLESLDRSAC